MSAVVESASTLAPPIETRVVSDDPSLEARSLYAVLTSRNELGAWNWSFYLPNDSDGPAPVGSDGTLFHAVMDSAGVWKFEHEHGYNVVSDPLVVAIVKLASLAFLGPYKDVIGDDGLMAIFGMVPIPNSPSHQPGDFSSRTWFLESIGTLGDCGILTCEDLWLLEREIRRCAFMAMDNFLDLDNRRRTAHNERSMFRIGAYYDTSSHIHRLDSLCGPKLLVTGLRATMD
ncbi:hypothetical protein DL96DRAFT_1473415 [Flagelloscypha sp. PMI_526]|nr:hypothetical protein DL96DRAFT_1473415 [Flagelloscypha sp. PMI_526]